VIRKPLSRFWTCFSMTLIAGQGEQRLGHWANLAMSALLNPLSPAFKTGGA